MDDGMNDREIQTIARDPLWLAHRYDPGHDAVHFVRLDREGHRKATFLIDEYLPSASSPVVLARNMVGPAARAVEAPIHFLFHSAFCCSTLMARAFDQDGWAMGLKEPVILNDLVGWHRRGASRDDLKSPLDDVLALLGRGFSQGEAVIVKPSNIVNRLAGPILEARPAARALLMYAPLRTFLASVAKKGMWGRLWVRGLFIGLMKDGLVDLGFDAEQFFGQTDLQIGAMGWLAQHALFHQSVERFGPSRVRTLDSETLLADPAAVLARLASFYDLPAGSEHMQSVADGPIFSSHSKTGTAFDASSRADEYRLANAHHADEIEKVALWAEQVARHRGIALGLPAPLLG